VTARADQVELVTVLAVGAVGAAFIIMGLLEKEDETAPTIGGDLDRYLVAPTKRLLGSMRDTLDRAWVQPFRDASEYVSEHTDPATLWAQNAQTTVNSDPGGRQTDWQRPAHAR